MLEHVSLCFVSTRLAPDASFMRASTERARAAGPAGPRVTLRHGLALLALGVALGVCLSAASARAASAAAATLRATAGALAEAADGFPSRPRSLPLPLLRSRDSR